MKPTPPVPIQNNSSVGVGTAHEQIYASEMLPAPRGQRVGPSWIPGLQLFAVLAFVLLFARAGLAQPVINAIYPPVINEHAGDHVAFEVKASGSGILLYQWYQSGTAIPGQTNAWLTLTNIQPANSGSYGVTVVDSTASIASNSAVLNVSSTYLPLYPTNLVVLRLGDGVQALSAATGNTIYLDQYTTTGVYVSTIQIPDEAAGQIYGAGGTKTVLSSPSVILPGAGGDSANQGALTLSGNQEFITLAGYQLAWPYTAGTDVTVGGANFIRGIYDVNGYGYPTLVYTNEGLYSGGNHTIRSAYTLDGTNFYTTGQAGSAGSVKYFSTTNTAYATGSGIPTISSSFTGARVVQSANGNLVFTDAGTNNEHGLWAVPGLPEPAANAAVTPSQLEFTEGGTPNDFAISPDGATVYIADSQPYGGATVQAGGIERWDLVSGSYTYSYTLAVTGGTNGAQNLTAVFPPGIGAWGQGVTGAVLYATEALPATNSIVSIVDNGSGSVPTTIVTAGPNQVLHGLRFGPAAFAGLAIAAQPTNQTIFVGNSATFSVAVQGGAGPYSYQWQLNGVNLTNATQSSLTVSNVQSASAGDYSVIVSNPATFTVSSNAVLTVALGRPVITANLQSRVETVGDHLAFALQALGTLPINYQWYFNSALIPGATNSALVLTNIQTASAGSYFVTATNIYGGTNSLTATLGVTTALQTLSSNNLVVARVGDGAQTLSGATGNTIYLDQFTTNGAYVSSIQIPDQGAGEPYGYGPGTNVSASVNLPPGSQPLLVAGAGPDAPYEALLTLSADDASLNFAGYVQAYPANVPDVSYTDEVAAGNSTNNWRGIGGVSAFGYYSLGYTNSGLYSGGNHTIRSATTLEGVNFWTTGQSSASGIKYASLLTAGYATGIGVPVITSSGTGTHVVQILNGNLAFSDAAGASGPGIYASAGTPEPAKTGTGSASLLINEGGSPVDFAASPDGQTVYVSDDGASAQPGGIQRWDSNGGGGYNYSYTLATGTNLAGARGLAVSFPAGITTWGAGVDGAIVFATTTESLNNRLIKITDNGAGSVAATLATSGPNELYTGLRFGPSLVPVGFYNNPQATNLIAGQSATFSAVATGSRPYSYQWQLNDTNIVGATNALLTLSGLQTNSTGAYTLVVSNGISFASTTAVQLTVLAAPQFTGSTIRPGGQGFQLSFTGPAGYSYSVWSTSNLTLKPVTSTWTQLETGFTFSGGTDTFTDDKSVNDTNQFYIITVP
jgi:hypothetical protein